MMTRKNRRGDHMRKLSDGQVAMMRLKWSKGYPPKDLAEDYGISLNAVYNIVSGRTWKHLPVLPLNLEPVKLVKKGGK